MTYNMFSGTLNPTQSILMIKSHFALMCLGKMRRVIILFQVIIGRLCSLDWTHREPTMACISVVMPQMKSAVLKT